MTTRKTGVKGQCVSITLSSKIIAQYQRAPDISSRKELTVFSLSGVFVFNIIFLKT